MRRRERDNLGGGMGRDGKTTSVRVLLLLGDVGSGFGEDGDPGLF
jgi:hypothetical protein